MRSNRGDLPQLPRVIARSSGVEVVELMDGFLHFTTDDGASGFDWCNTTP